MSYLDQECRTAEGQVFDFNEVIDRRRFPSMKWGSAEIYLTPQERTVDPLPMWVADMDFKTAPPVVDAVREAARFGVYGYTGVAGPEYLGAVVNWEGMRFGWDIAPEWIVPTPGVITGLRTLIQTFTSPGDSILIQPPVYSHFHTDVEANGRRVALAPLVLNDNRYTFDVALFEGAIREDTTAFILSNPHNPTGNVWSKADLMAMGEICRRHDVLVISDEIHQDLMFNPSCAHTPMASLCPEFLENTITCTSASKSFNLAGLQCANLIVPDASKRRALLRAINRSFFEQINLFGLIATQAAYSDGLPWLEAMLAYVLENRNVFATEVNARTRGITVVESDALYLAWLDCRQLAMSDDALNHAFITKAGLWFDRGRKFHFEGEGFMRANLACPRARVLEAVSRLSDAFPNR